MTLSTDLPTIQSFASGEIDFNLLPPRLRPLTLEQSTSPLWRNMASTWLRAQELSQQGVGADFQASPSPAPSPLCSLCKGTRLLRVGFCGRLPQYTPCPDCLESESARALAVQRYTINRHWHMPPVHLSPFMDREDAPMALVARNAQQQIMERMPDATTLLMVGPPGTGKTRLGAEIAVVARQRGLGAIFKTLEALRQILQNFGGSDSERAQNKARRDMAWSHLLCADVVVIDEIDHAQGDAIQESLLEILNHRLAHRLTTVLAGNDDTGLIDPVKSRLYANGNLAVDMTGDSDARLEFGIFGAGASVAYAGGD